MGDGLQVRVKDGSLRVQGLAVTVGGGGFRVEALGNLVLDFGREVGMVLEDYDLVLVQSLLDDIKVGIYRATWSASLNN